MSDSEQDEPTVTTELGLEVQERTAVWREHTAERWKRDDPDGYAEAIHLIKTGVTNQSELARIFGKSRNTVLALMMSDEFSPGEIESIIRRAALIGTAQMQDKLMELTDNAKSTKDLGGVAMGLTTMHNIKQISTGGPTEIKETRHRFSIEDFEAERERRRVKTLNSERPTLNIEAEVLPPAEMVTVVVDVPESA